MKSLPEVTVRPAQLSDSLVVSSILAQAFPSLYTWAFGNLDNKEVTRLLHSLYQAGLLSLASTRLAVQDSQVVGVAILHLEGSIGRGTIRSYWRIVAQALGLRKGMRALLGGVFANIAISSRIPSGRDLLYIEALAVDPQLRNRGIGSTLLSDATVQAKSLGRSRLALHVLQSNTGARRLYERFGFHPNTREPPPAPEGSRRRQWISLLMILDL